MKIQITTAALVLAAVPAFSQSPATGVSNPDPAVISSTDDAAPVNSATAYDQAERCGARRLRQRRRCMGRMFHIRGETAAAGTSVVSIAPPENPLDAMIVTSVPERQGELREGTLLQDADEGYAFYEFDGGWEQIYSRSDGGGGEKWPRDHPDRFDSRWPSDGSAWRKADLGYGDAASGDAECDSAGWDALYRSCTVDRYGKERVQCG